MRNRVWRVQPRRDGISSSRYVAHHLFSSLSLFDLACLTCHNFPTDAPQQYQNSINSNTAKRVNFKTETITKILDAWLRCSAHRRNWSTRWRPIRKNITSRRMWKMLGWITRQVWDWVCGKSDFWIGHTIISDTEHGGEWDFQILTHLLRILLFL